MQRSNALSSSDPEIAKALAVLATKPELEIRERQKVTPRQHVVVWVVGAVIASLLPLAFTLFQGVDRNKVPGFYQLLGTGDLLLVGIVISIAGIAELVLVVRQTSPNQTIPVALLILGNLLLVASSGLWFGDLASLVLAGKQTNPDGILAFGTITVFALAAVLSSACVWLAAGVD